MRSNQYIKRVLTLCLLLSATMAVHAQKENLDTLFDIHHILAYLVAGFLITVFVMLFFNRLYYYREKDARSQSDRLNAQLSMVLDSNKTRTWTYDVAHDLFIHLSVQDMKETKYTSFDFSQSFDREDFKGLLKAINTVQEGDSLSALAYVKSNQATDQDVKQRTYEITVSVLRRDKKGSPSILLGIQTDISEEQERIEKNRRLMLRYQTVFNSSLVDMIFYDGNGYLTEINDKACETFGISDREALLRRKVKITDIPAYRHLDLNDLSSFMVTSATDITKVKQRDERIPEVTVKGKMYYEADVRTIHDDQGRLSGIVAAGRNITEMVQSNHRQQKASQLLNKTTADIQAYINNINYTLKVSDVRLMNYYPDSHELEIYSDLNSVQYCLTQMRAITMLVEKERRRARGLFRRMDSRRKQVFSNTFRTILRDAEGRHVYLNFHVMPIMDKDGHVTHYFGMCRNMTEMVYTEQMLQEETAKAQETEQLKNSFLLNMSYELRTPLNAVVGFAELYNGEHSPEDEPVFAQEIKSNTNVLLELINDILFISRLDAHMIEFDIQPCDFASLFDGWCYMGWSTLGNEVKIMVENPYSRLEVGIDQQNLGMVLERLCAYSAYGMQEGAVRAKYEYRLGELMITIEDTGRGLSAEDQAKAFDRFVRNSEGELHGTGLDLPIVKELIEQMGGSIELQSEEGKGTTFYVNIPCELISFERKSEVIA